MTEFPKTLPSRILQVVTPELEDSEIPRDAVKRVMANKGRAEIEIADSKVLICCQIPQ